LLLNFFLTVSKCRRIDMPLGFLPFFGKLSRQKARLRWDLTGSCTAQIRGLRSYHSVFVRGFVVIFPYD